MKNRQTIFTAILLALGSFALSSIAQAVVPAPDGGYAGGNTAEGQNALLGLTSGTFNTAVGWFALRSATTGQFNTALGAGALLANTGDQNTATGAGALLSDTTGFDNTANGAFALFSNTVGNNNTANGRFALLNNTTGAGNTANGTDALRDNTTGSGNTANGEFALITNIDGSSNTAIGANALERNQTGASNTAVGDRSLLNTTGGANTAVGAGAGQNVNEGSFNVYIGTGVDGVAGEIGHTYIANIASTQQNLSAVTVDLATGLLGHEFSSRRYKEDIKPMDNASELLYQLQPVTYRYKKDIDPRQHLDYGLIAEEVAKVDPKLASRDGKGQIESVRYTAINVMLLNEFFKEHRKVQEQAHAIRDQKAQIRELKNEMETVVACLKEQDSKIQKVSAQVEIGKSAAKLVAVEP